MVDNGTQIYNTILATGNLIYFNKNAQFFLIHFTAHEIISYTMFVLVDCILGFSLYTINEFKYRGHVVVQKVL